MIDAAKSRKDDHQQVVVVTGASAGLGRAIAREFARHGAHIGLIARGRERLESAEREMADLGGQAIAISADVADSEEVERAAQRVESEFGHIDVWVNNAMTTVFAEFADIAPDEYRRATEVTYLGTVWGTRAALKRMLPRNAGSIVQVGSALAYRSIPLQSPYCGAKHAIAGFTDSLRTELIHRKSGIHLSMVQMPALNTPQFEWCRTRLPRRPQPVPPIYNPEEPARAVYWAARHHPRELYVGYSTRAVILGNKVAPGMLGRYLGRSGYGSQQSAEAVREDRPDNLFEPVPGKFASHGRFDRIAVNRGFSPGLRRAAQAAGVIAGIAMAAACLMRVASA